MFYKKVIDANKFISHYFFNYLSLTFETAIFKSILKYIRPSIISSTAEKALWSQCLKFV